MTVYAADYRVPVGTQVRVVGEGSSYGGQVGEVVNAPLGEKTWSSLRPGTRITWVDLPSRETPFGFYTNYLERYEDMTTKYGSNLVGPKPEPVKEPEFVTPLRADGTNIVDANGKVVTRIQFGGYTRGTYRSELPTATKYALAELFSKAVNETYGKKEEKTSPF